MERQRGLSVAQKKEQVDRFISAKAFSKFKKVEKFSDHYRVTKELGSGAFGTVKLGQHRKSQVPCAIKIIKKSSLKVADVYLDLMKNELQVLENTIHPHITRVFELMEDNRSYYIIMELISGGNLLDIIYAEKKFSEHKAGKVMRQLLLALNFMHKKNITHRDLKPENLLCEKTDDGSISVKLTDFGFACYYKSDAMMSLSLGSPLYMAPELCAEDLYNEKVDVWACGVITYILLTGQPPFVGGSKDEIYENIQKMEPNYNQRQLRQCQATALDFIKKCLNKDPSLRPSVQVALLGHGVEPLVLKELGDAWTEAWILVQTLFDEVKSGCLTLTKLPLIVVWLHFLNVLIDFVL